MSERAADQGDAAVLAEALAAQARWLLGHDKRHILAAGARVAALTIGTPGDLIAALRDRLTNKTPEGRR